MKYFVLFIVLLISTKFYSQEAKYQTYTARMEVIASKDGNEYKWENSNILVNLNYKTGDFKIELKNSDFYSKESTEPVNNENPEEEITYILKGFLPIERIIDQKLSTQDYTVELQLTNNDINFSEVINFKMNVMRTSQQSGSYRVFSFVGTLYNDEINLPAFEGYDNEVGIRILFNAFWNG